MAIYGSVSKEEAEALDRINGTNKLPITETMERYEIQIGRRRFEIANIERRMKTLAWLEKQNGSDPKRQKKITRLQFLLERLKRNIQSLVKERVGLIKEDALVLQGSIGQSGSVKKRA